ncbi:hypothetical protein [Bradyrhizobium sp. Ec3.3]|uniref:hypothetical protein n=1 Tax=Bradyrhizobium sp. Ec3.3 TaxID=189753 RepID=UPI0003F8F745|nr:hypothetical protein [Bradyrhizobium sp. Ec3.3]
MTVIDRLERLLLEGEFDGEITFLTVKPADGLDWLFRALSLSEPAVLFADPVFADAGSLPVSYAPAAAILKSLQEI